MFHKCSRISSTFHKCFLREKLSSYVVGGAVSQLVAKISPNSSRLIKARISDGALSCFATAESDEDGMRFPFSSSSLEGYVDELSEELMIELKLLPLSFWDLGLIS